MHSAIAISRTDQLAAYLSTSWSQYIPLWNRSRGKNYCWNCCALFSSLTDLTHIGTTFAASGLSPRGIR
jgi:hypothetical protein